MFTSYLMDIGFQKCIFSENILIKGSGENQVFIAIHVGDAAIMSQNLGTLDSVINQITTKFETGEPAPIEKYLGLNIVNQVIFRR